MTKSRFAGVRYRFRPWFTVWITVMWCMLMGEITVGNVVGGLLVALVIVFALPLPAMPIAGVVGQIPALHAALVLGAVLCLPQGGLAGLPAAATA